MPGSAVDVENPEVRQRLALRPLSPTLAGLPVVFAAVVSNAVRCETDCAIEFFEPLFPEQFSAFLNLGLLEVGK